MATLKTKIKIRRDTATNLANVVLEASEPAYATDTKKFAIGDGSTKFSELKDYGFTPDLSDFVTGPANATDNAIAIFDGTTGKQIKNSGSSINSNGYITTPRLLVTANNNTLTIGAQNASFCHIYNSASIPFIFNQAVEVTGDKDLGTSQYDWKNLYLSGSIKKVKSTTDATTYTLSLPNKEGTIALISDIPSLADYVKGPTNATDNALVRFNGTTGKIVQNSGITVDDNSNLTTKGVVKIQNGAAGGAFVLGADVNATTLIGNTRKLGRMGVPSYDSSEEAPKTVAGISFDSQAAANYADFGGHPNNAASIAPDVIRFIVATEHNNSITGKRKLALQIAGKAGLVDSAGGGTSVEGAKFFVPVQATEKITGDKGFEHGGLTVATGKTKNDYILLAGGGTKAVSDFAMSDDLDDFVTKSTTQTITGIKTFVGQTVIKSSAATSSADNTVNGFKFVTSTDKYVGKIASNDAGAIGFYGQSALYFRPVIGTDGKVDTNYGVTMDKNGLFPGSTAMNLGTSTKPWGSVYGTTYYENGTSLADKYALKTELPTVNDGTLTLKASDGVTATQKTFTANDADNVTFEVKHAAPTGAAAGSYGPSAGGEQAAKGTLDITVPQITTDKFGHVTAVTNKTFKVIDTDTTYNNATTTTDGLMSADDKKNLTYYVKGTQTASTNAWTGNLTQVSALYEGLTIRYRLPYAGNGSGVTLNLTLSSGATGAKTVYRLGTSTQITTHFGAGSIITMTYNGTA